ncbi:MAG TPA: hypothetical protein VFR11_09065 [Micromonosporaceae bacterium]|jgi:uncharacterized membrane protein (DUF2068 family)|nr:hypothetical protein [Micromonosporaceae bacterium]
MSRARKVILGILGLLTALDVVSAVTASRITGSNKPPAAAIVAIALFAVLTVIGMYGLVRGARWARPLIYVTRVLNCASNLLGFSNHPTATQLAVGSVTFGLSIVVIVALVVTRRSDALERPAAIAVRGSRA